MISETETLDEIGFSLSKVERKRLPGLVRDYNFALLYTRIAVSYASILDEREETGEIKQLAKESFAGTVSVGAEILDLFALAEEREVKRRMAQDGLIRQMRWMGIF